MTLDEAIKICENVVIFSSKEYEQLAEWLVDNKNNQYYILSGFNTIVLTENELIKRGLNPQYYEIVRDYVSEMEYIEWTQ